MSIAIVIVNYRAYAELRACLQQLDVRRDDTRIVVVDQAPLAAELERLRQEFPAVVFVESPDNRGFAAGVNLGARHCDGHSLLLLNPDCQLSPHALERLAQWMEANPEVGAVGPCVRDPNGRVQESARRFPDVTTAFAGRRSWLTRTFPGNRLSRRNLLATNGTAEPTEVDWVSGACVLVRRRAFESIGGMDAGFFLYWEDADLGRRLRTAGWKTVYHPGVEVIHAVGASSQFIPVRSAMAFHRSALRYYWKHSSAALRLVVPVVAVGLGTRLLLLLLWNYSHEMARGALGRSLPADQGEHVSPIDKFATRIAAPWEIRKGGGRATPQFERNSSDAG